MTDDGSGGNGFAGLPIMRVTHLTTGQARFYSLLDGALLVCSDRSAVLASPTENRMADQGVLVDCAAQPLTAQERAVFAHVRVTGTYERYGPLEGEPMFHGAGDVFDRHVRVDAVLVEEVDGLDLEPLERGLRDLLDVAPGVRLVTSTPVDDQARVALTKLSDLGPWQIDWVLPDSPRLADPNGAIAAPRSL